MYHLIHFSLQLFRSQLQFKTFNVVHSKLRCGNETASGNSIMNISIKKIIYSKMVLHKTSAYLKRTIRFTLENNRRIKTTYYKPSCKHNNSNKNFPVSLKYQTY